jgi:hypothetical protein
MACSLCGVRGLDMPCRAHAETWKQAHENQRSKQIMVASSLTPPEVLDGFYSVPYQKDSKKLQNRILKAICEGIDGTGIITVPEIIADINF